MNLSSQKQTALSTGNVPWLVLFLLGGLLTFESAFAEGRAKPDQIYGLDNMISPTAAKAVKPIRKDSERTLGEVIFGNNVITRRMNEEAARGLQAEIEVKETTTPLEEIREDRAPSRWQAETRVERMPLRSIPVVVPPPTVVAAPTPVPSRLTESMPAAPAPSYVASGFWDELNNARERARRALEESWKAEEPKPAPVNYPGEVPGRRQLSPQLASELNQVNALAPQQAGLGFTGMPSTEPVRSGFADKSVAADALADEVREVEQEAGFLPGSGKSSGTERLLASIQTEDGVSPSESAQEDGTPMLRPLKVARGGNVPMLRPRKIAGRRRSATDRALAAALQRNSAARGSTAGQARESAGVNYQVSGYRDVPSNSNLYRHLQPEAAAPAAKPLYQELPSRPRGQNIRYHSTGSSDEE